MKQKSAPRMETPVKTLLSAAYGPGKLTAQLLALFFTRFFAVTALARELHAQHKTSKRVATLEKGFALARSAYLDALVEETRKAVQTGDAQFFTDFANALEEGHRSSRGRDPVRCWLMMHKLKGGAPLTARQMTDSVIKEAGTTISDRQIYRLCKELGIEVAKGQEGRPPKLRQMRENKAVVVTPQNG